MTIEPYLLLILRHTGKTDKVKLANLLYIRSGKKKDIFANLGLTERF